MNLHGHRTQYGHRAKTDTWPKILIRPKIDIWLNMETWLKTGIEPNVDVEPNMDIWPRTGIGPSVDIGSYIDTRPKTEIWPYMDIGPNIDRAETDMWPKILIWPKTRIGPNVDIGPNMDIGPKIYIGPKLIYDPKFAWPKTDTGSNLDIGKISLDYFLYLVSFLTRMWNFDFFKLKTAFFSKQEKKVRNRRSLWSLRNLINRKNQNSNSKIVNYILKYIFIFQFFLWILWIFPIKSQIYPKPFNFYEPVSSNGLVSPSILKPYKPLIISYPDSQRDLSWMKNSKPQLQKKAPQRQQFVLYYPPPKPNYNPNEKYPNIKAKNTGIKNHKNYNYYNKNKSQNKIVPEEPEELQYEGNVSLENLEAAKERVKIKNGEAGNDGVNNQIRNREPNKNLNYGNEDSYPPVPNSFMEPPGFATSDYRLYQKADGNFVGGNKKDYKKENYYKNHKMNGEEDFDKNFDDRAPYVRDHAPEKESEVGK